MEKYIDQRKRSFWLKLGALSCEEAVLLIHGDIPTQDQLYDEYEDMGGKEVIVRRVDMNGDNDLLKLLKSSFPNERVPPKDLFRWCRDNSIFVNPDVVAEASKIRSLAVNATDFRESKDEPSAAKAKVSKHWEEKRQIIISAAIQILNGLARKDVEKYFRPIGGLNVAKIAEDINDRRHRWPSLKNELRGASTENIKKTLRDAANGRSKKSSE